MFLTVGERHAIGFRRRSRKREIFAGESTVTPTCLDVRSRLLLTPPDACVRSGAAGLVPAPRRAICQHPAAMFSRSTAQRSAAPPDSWSHGGRRGPAVIKESMRDRVTLHNVVYMNRATNPKKRLIVPHLSG